MRVPRDIGGHEFAKALARYGYEVTRQSGSHVRLTTHQHGEHHITIPAHDSLRIGTLSAVLAAVAEHFGKEKSQIMEELWG